MAAGRKYAQSEASEKKKTKEGGKKSVSAQPDGPNDGTRLWG
jgi:hypothetical protein